MKKILYVILLSFLYSAYSVGDIVSNAHQNQEFEVCYPSAMDNTITLGDYNGNTNGGDYNILVIDASATWCGPCQSLIPLFDELQENYSDNDYVKFFVALSDLNQPYSCSQWGNMGTSGIPLIIDDTGYPLFNMFNTGSSFPSLALVDHNMKVYYKEAGYYPTFVEDISSLLDDMLYDIQNFAISVTPVNDAPIIISTAPTEAMQGEEYIYQILVEDPDDSEFTYLLFNAPDEMNINFEKAPLKDRIIVYLGIILILAVSWGYIIGMGWHMGTLPFGTEPMKMDGSMKMDMNNKSLLESVLTWMPPMSGIWSFSDFFLLFKFNT